MPADIPAEPYWWDGSPTRPPTPEEVRQWCAEQEANEGAHKCPGSGSIGLKRRDGYIRCPKCKQLLIPLSPLNKVPTHPARLTAHIDGLEGGSDA